LLKGYNCAMVAYKQDDAKVAKHPPKVATAAKASASEDNDGKYPPKRDSTDGQASAGEEATKMSTAAKHPQGVGHDALGSKASARAGASDNGGKASARLRK
jgi:hypothetical protein